MSTAESLRPHKRRGFWYLVRRVPEELRERDPRGTVFISTGIRIQDDPRAKRARDKLRDLNDALEAYWQQVGPRPKAAPTPYQRSVAIAQDHGVPYLVMPQVTALPADAFYQRMDAVAGDGDADTAAALLGAVPVPPLMVSDLPKQCAQILRATLAQKSPRQRHKWDKERAMIIALFRRETGGDRPLAELNRTHATAFRDYWTERVAQGEVAIETCNRNIGRLSGMLGTVIRHHRLPLENIFEDIRIRGAAPKQRIAFDPEFIQARLLATGALDGLNDEARAVLYLMAETGVRISEACNLNKRTIMLDHRIPHIRIQPDQRQLKTAHSERDIPLVGVALKVMRAHPDGFPRYVDKADVLSTTVNKFLRENGLVPNGESLYSLRHSFEDRLTSVEAPDKVNATLMGHKWHRPKYGKGPTLDQKLEWLLRIAFTAPLRV